MSDSINRLIVRQREIASVIRSWLEWDTGNRAEHGLTVEGNTHIMALPVPVWPTHSQFVCWIETCEGAADALASRPSATDYRNRGERDAAYWRDRCADLIYSTGTDLDRVRIAVVAELARINAEALR